MDNKMKSFLKINGPKRYQYSDVVVGLAQSNDPESYAGSSIATDRASHARWVKCDEPYKNRYPSPPG